MKLTIMYQIFFIKNRKISNWEIADLSPHNALIHVFVKYVLKMYKFTLTLIIRDWNRLSTSSCVAVPSFVISKEQRD